MLKGQKQNIKKGEASYYLTLTVVGWVDIFTRECYRKTILSTLKFCVENKDLNIYAYCIMSNHIHVIVNCNPPFQLQDVIRDFKKFSSKRIIQQITEEPESRREWLLDWKFR